MEEKQSIKDSVRCLRKYGSVSNYNYTKIPSHYFRHMVTENDTLQGIALKYGVTTEEVRRVNKLWANDSLFLRESLLIPSMNGTVPSTSGTLYVDALSEPDLFVNQSTDEITRQQQQQQHNHQNGFSRSDSLRSSFSSSYRDDDDLDSYNEFLNRIDANIANKRQQLKITQNNSLFSEDSNSHSRKKPALSRLKQQQQQQQQHRVVVERQERSPSDIPLVMTQSRRVRSSLQRMQENQEQIFEL